MERVVVLSVGPSGTELPGPSQWNLAAAIDPDLFNGNPVVTGISNSLY